MGVGGGEGAQHSKAFVLEQAFSTAAESTLADQSYHPMVDCCSSGGRREVSKHGA